MGDHVIVTREKLVETATSITENHVAIHMENLNVTDTKEEKTIVTDGYEEENTGGEKGECRYCQEEDFVSNLISPCNCTGSLKYIHKSCLDQWYNVKGCCILCEICKKIYPDYYPLPEIISSDDDEEYDIINHISEDPELWTISGTDTQIQSPVVVAGLATNSFISSMNWRNPTFDMIVGIILLLLVGGLVTIDAIASLPPKEEKFNRFLYFTVVPLIAVVYIMLWVYKCQEYRNELRQREIERERELNVV